MRRQQRVLLALAHQVDPIELLPTVPELLKIAGDPPLDDARSQRSPDWPPWRPDRPEPVETVTFTPPVPSHDYGLDQADPRVVRHVFDEPAPEPTPSPTGTEPPIDTCRG
jgi:hypothetical protein